MNHKYYEVLSDAMHQINELCIDFNADHSDCQAVWRFEPYTDDEETAEFMFYFREYNSDRATTEPKWVTVNKNNPNSVTKIIYLIANELEKREEGEKQCH